MYKTVVIEYSPKTDNMAQKVEEKANETYNRSVKNHFMKKICCDFRLLEEKSDEYKK